MKGINRVVIVISNISIGGAQRIALTLADWLLNRNIDVKLLSIGESSGNYDVPSNVSVAYMNHKSNRQTVPTIRRMNKFFVNEKPDVVITMGVSTCIFSVPALAGVHGVKHIISERNDPKHFLGKKYVKYISRFFMRFGDGFVFQTDDAKSFYSKKLKNKGVVIPNPLSTNKLPDALNFPKEKVIVTMGRLTKQKNHKLLIDAFDVFWQSHSDYELHIYGSGELETETKDYIMNKSSTKSIKMFAACNDALERIRKAEIFVLSSDFEGMPNALIEAMAMGLPCISTDCPCGGPRYLINDSENGFLVPINDVVSLSNKLSYVAENESLRNEIARQAFCIRKNLSTEVVSKQWFDYCCDLCL